MTLLGGWATLERDVDKPWFFSALTAWEIPLPVSCVCSQSLRGLKRVSTEVWGRGLSMALGPWVAQGF